MNWKHWLELPDVACAREFNSTHSFTVLENSYMYLSSTDTRETVSSEIFLVLKRIYLSLQFFRLEWSSCCPWGFVVIMNNLNYYSWIFLIKHLTTIRLLWLLLLILLNAVSLVPYISICLRIGRSYSRAWLQTLLELYTWKEVFPERCPPKFNSKIFICIDIK